MVRKFFDSESRTAYVVGHGLGASRADMEGNIIPAVRTDFPKADRRDASLTVLLRDHGTKGEETVVGTGIRIAVPRDVAIPDGYLPLPDRSVRRGEMLGEDIPETFTCYLIERGCMAFYVSSVIGCTIDGLEALFRAQDRDFPDADREQSFLLFFSRGEERGKVGLRFETEPSSVCGRTIAVRELPRCVP